MSLAIAAACPDHGFVLEESTLAATSTSASGPGRQDDLQLRRGHTAGRFVVIDELGRGAMGTVYSAFDAKLERQVALKILNRSGRGMVSLLAEAQALAKVNHRNVVTIYDVGEHEGRLYLAMELVHGATLRQWQSAKDRPWREIVEVYREAARGLHAVHAADLVHGDFKPDNVMVAEDGRVLVMDFGIARSLDKALSGDDLSTSSSGSRSIQVSRIRGTPAYMAPEQLRLDGVGPTSDQFAFCIALYEALWRERPFAGETLAELSSNVANDRRKPRPASEVPRWVAAVVDRGSSAGIDQRYPSMKALDDAFDQSLRRRMQRFTLMGAVGLTGIVAAAIALAPERRSPCEDAAAAFAEQLASAPVRALEARILGIEHRDAAVTAEQFAHNLDAFAREWREVNTSLCTANGLDIELRQARRRCLDRQRDALDVLVSVYTQAPSFDLSKVSNLASALPQPSSCGVLDDPLASEATDVEALIVAQESLARARALHQTGRTQAGLDLVDEEIQRVRQIDAPRLEAAMRLWKASKLRLMGRFDEALASSRDAQRAAARSGSIDLPCLAWLDRVSHTEIVAPNEAQLLEAQLEAAELALIEAGDPPGLRIRYLMRRAAAESRDDDPGAAIATLTEALALTETAPQRQQVVSNIHNLRAIAHVAAGDKLRAHQDFERAHDILEDAYGPYFPSLAQSRANLGAICADRGDLECARETFESALESLAASSSPAAPSKAHLEASLAEILYWLDDVEGSQTYAERSLETAKTGGFDELGKTVAARSILLRTLREQEDWARGDAVLADMLRINETQFGGTSRAAQALHWAAEYSALKEDLEAALSYARQAREIREAHLPPDDPAFVLSLQQEATGLLMLERLEDADMQLTRAESILDELAEPSATVKFSVAFARARLTLARGDRTLAETMATELVRMADPAAPEERKARAQVVAWMAEHELTPPAVDSTLPLRDGRSAPVPVNPG